MPFPFAFALLLAAIVPVAAAQEHPGAAPYQRVCQTCHGPEGRGDLAPRLVPLGFDVDYVLAVVREGYSQMPPISQRELSDDEVRQAVAFLDSLTAQTATTPGMSYDGPRTSDGRPDLNGIWQVLGAAAWDITAHNAQDGIPAGLSVVEGGEIPYQPWAATRQQEHYANRLTDDPVRSAICRGCRGSPTCRGPSGSSRRRTTWS